MRNLYRQTVENNNKLTLEIQSLKELKKFFIEQHGIIDKLEQTILHNKEEIQNLKQENEIEKEKEKEEKQNENLIKKEDNKKSDEKENDNKEQRKEWKKQKKK